MVSGLAGGIPWVRQRGDGVTTVDLKEAFALGTERIAILGDFFRRVKVLIEEMRPTTRIAPRSTPNGW